MILFGVCGFVRYVFPVAFLFFLCSCLYFCEVFGFFLFRFCCCLLPIVYFLGALCWGSVNLLLFCMVCVGIVLELVFLALVGEFCWQCRVFCGNSKFPWKDSHLF